jgi:TRAP-type C4-dicarboxylate transport system permease small subunit
MVDTFTARWPKRLRDGVDGVWSLLYAGFALLIAVQVGRGALETMANRTTTMVLGLPTGYAIGVAALMSLWLAYVCLDVAIRQLAGRWPER